MRDTTDQLRMRILVIKDRLPRKYMDRLKDKFPKYQKDKDLISRVYRVVAIQIVDEEIINDLESIIL